LQWRQTWTLAELGVAEVVATIVVPLDHVKT
jgi:hypothetical protein